MILGFEGVLACGVLGGEKKGQFLISWNDKLAIDYKISAFTFPPPFLPFPSSSLTLTPSEQYSSSSPS